MKLWKRFVVGIAFFGLGNAAAEAAINCDVSTSGAAFGNYDSIENQDQDTSGTITVSCSGTAGEAVSYGLSLGSGAGSYSNRQLSAGSNILNYNLYTDAARSQVWGDGTASTAVVTDSYTLTTSPTTRNYSVYGRIPQGQTQAMAGSYSDSTVVTLAY
jgi:spore coat protein U-like protein